MFLAELMLHFRENTGHQTQAELNGRCAELPWLLRPGSQCGPSLSWIKSGFLSNPQNNYMNYSK